MRFLVRTKRPPFFTEAAFRIYGISLLLLNQCSEFAVSCIFCKFQVDSSFFSHSLISSDSSFQVADNCVSVVCTSSYDSFQVRSCSVGFSNCVQSLRAKAALLDLTEPKELAALAHSPCSRYRTPRASPNSATPAALPNNC